MEYAFDALLLISNVKNMSKFKGIVLAGGQGVRLRPMTTAVNKHLLPVYDKPMIYYPISVLAQAGIREILLITTSQSLDAYEQLLGDGSKFGMDIQYTIQDQPNGVAEALLLSKKFIGNDNISLILGDNFFYGPSVANHLAQAIENESGATVFAYPVSDPERFGIVEFDKQGKAIKLQEKPKFPNSKYAVTGLYFYDNKALEYAETLSPSARGELEITDINQHYLSSDSLNVQIFGEDNLWFDLGTHESLLQAGNLVREIQSQNNIQIGCIEEIALSKGWIDKELFKDLALNMLNTSYGRYLNNIYTMEL